MQASLSENKKSVLRNRNYVFLEGAWRHKGGEASVSDFAVRVLGDDDFGASMDRYTAALSRRVHEAHLGEELFTFKP